MPEPASQKPVPPAASRRMLPWALVTALVLAGGAAAVWWSRPAVPAVTAFPDDDAVLDGLLVVPNPGYVGMAACAKCHADRVKEFEGTAHARACWAPRPDRMPPGFDPGRGNFASRVPGLRFEMTRIGNDFFQTSIRATPAGDERTKSPIDLVYGAGVGDSVFLSGQGDRLYELPVVWLYPQQQWGASPFDPHGAGSFARDMTPRCLECHNTWMEHAPGSRNRYDRRNILLGATCEKCHGPGREHVIYHENHPAAADARHIVRPAELPRDRHMELCGQCHSNAIRPRHRPFTYRPGEPLDRHFVTMVSKYPEDDHVANQDRYLRESKCYQKSELTCVTCHNPHRPVGRAATQRACMKCHQPAECKEQPRLPAGMRGADFCSSCHMPASMKVQVSFDTEDDLYVPPVVRNEHRIAVYPATRDQLVSAWYATHPDAAGKAEVERLRQSVAGHWLAEAEKLRQQHRYIAAAQAYREALSVDAAPATRAKLKETLAAQAKFDHDYSEANEQMRHNRFADAIATLEGVLRLKPNHALTHGKLGTALAAAGRRPAALEQLRAVAKLDPDEPYGHAMLGWLAYLDGDNAGAAEHYRRADAREPFDVKTQYHWGLALTKLQRWPAAEERFRRGLDIDPTHAGVHQGLANALLRQDRPADAVPHALRAARLTEFRNADVLLTLIDAFAAAGRPADARFAAQGALDSVPAANPELTVQIRRRLEDLAEH
jgi:tetratricopeptide (TPR) repeat protein